jgi:hypothetical protein
MRNGQREHERPRVPTQGEQRAEHAAGEVTEPDAAVEADAADSCFEFAPLGRSYGGEQATVARSRSWGFGS